MNEIQEFLQLEVTHAFLEKLREVSGLPLALGPKATTFDVLRQSALERAKDSFEWAEMCARLGFAVGGGDE